MTTQNNTNAKLYYNGCEFSQTEVQEMLDNKDQYIHADNLPKWMAVNISTKHEHTLEASFLATWAFLTTFCKL